MRLIKSWMQSRGSGSDKICPSDDPHVTGLIFRFGMRVCLLWWPVGRFQLGSKRILLCRGDALETSERPETGNRRGPAWPAWQLWNLLRNLRPPFRISFSKASRADIFSVGGHDSEICCSSKWECSRTLGFRDFEISMFDFGVVPDFWAIVPWARFSSSFLHSDVQMQIPSSF
ncbi:hypothetical protein TNCT_282641 [Trichonephila clavata]|uniref:Uncharacterized protein n=1 Tax=Trichonephila clavata TaxID=2740835 RepID=A0A8X6HH64_TRICU|nr:hypothetical protein TNCT_282641 [Trichonephila clavata]